MIDRCAGRRLAEWLRDRGHDVVESRTRGPDPGDRALLGWAAQEGRVLVTIDADFGALIFRESEPHGGVVRLPDVLATRRIELMAQVIEQYGESLDAGAIITVRGTRIRVSRP